MDKYKLPLNLRLGSIYEQIQEMQKIIFRNEIEDRVAKVTGNKATQKEVEYNNDQLREKLDVLFGILEELKKEENEDRRGATIPGPTL